MAKKSASTTATAPAATTVEKTAAAPRRAPRLGDTVIFRPNSTSLAADPSAVPLAAIVSRVIGGRENAADLHVLTPDGFEVITDMPFGTKADAWEHWEFRD